MAAIDTPDSKIPGLYMRTLPSGKRSASVRYVHGGQQRRLSLGVLGEAFTVTQARKVAKLRLAEVAQGRDPARERKTERAAETFAQVASRWIDEHATPTCRPATAKRYRELVAHLIPSLGGVKVVSITRADVERAHRKIGDKEGRAGGKAHATANRALLVASAIFGWCESRGIRVPGSNPCRGIKRFRERGAGHFYSSAQLARIGDVLDAAAEIEHGNAGSYGASTVAVVRLLMVTGARLSEITNLRWTEVDLDRGQLVLGDTKTGRSVRPLIPQAVQLLRSLKARRTSTSPWVCPSANGGPLDPTRVDRAWRSIRERARLPDGARLHDLRHTAGSLALAAGIPLPLVSKMLGHKSVATTAKIYAHALAESETAAMVKAGDAFAAMVARGRVENAAAANVTPLRRRGR